MESEVKPYQPRIRVVSDGIVRDTRFYYVQEDGSEVDISRAVSTTEPVQLFVSGSLIKMTVTLLGVGLNVTGELANS